MKLIRAVPVPSALHLETDNDMLKTTHANCILAPADKIAHLLQNCHTPPPFYLKKGNLLQVDNDKEHLNTYSFKMRVASRRKST
jgi:hypothetical protein